MIREIFTSQLLLIGVFGAAESPDEQRIDFGRDYPNRDLYQGLSPREALMKRIMFYSEEPKIKHWMDHAIEERIKELKKSGGICPRFRPDKKSELPKDRNSALERYEDYIINLVKPLADQKRPEAIENAAIAGMIDLANDDGIFSLDQFEEQVPHKFLTRLQEQEESGAAKRQPNPPAQKKAVPRGSSSPSRRARSRADSRPRRTRPERLEQRMVSNGVGDQKEDPVNDKPDRALQALHNYYDYLCKDKQSKDDPANGAKELLRSIEGFLFESDKNVLEIITQVRSALENPVTEGKIVGDPDEAAEEARARFCNKLAEILYEQ